jgi:hypothetical protein
MKLIYYLFIIAWLAAACTPKISSSFRNKQTALSDSSFVLVLQVADTFNNDGIEVGDCKTGDKGFSVNCTYYEVIEGLKQMARQSGANLIKIYKRKGPDWWSSCERLSAKMFKVPDLKKHEKIIEWSSKRKLVWDDFKGIPKRDADSTIAAGTNCGFGFNAVIRPFLKQRVFAINTFNCMLSWVLPQQNQNPILLAHEQLHFDICEVYTRQLRKQFRELHNVLANEKINLIFRTISEKYTARQLLYDSETVHGSLPVKQKEWELQVSRELAELAAYEK